MRKFVINYHTGTKETVEVASLEEAKDEAIRGMEYTQQNVSIETEEGQLLATSYWYDIEPTEEDDVLEQIGNYGFYADWIEE